MFKGFMKEFKEFAIKGDAVELAVGVVIGAAFGAIAKSLVDDMLMPLLSLVTGRVDFPNLFWVLSEGKVPGPYATLAAAKMAGAATVNYGQFINSIVTFLFIAVAVFVMVRAMNRLRRRPQPAKRECPYCTTEISKAALRCPACTSELEALE
jgi:large conductance mechanosensitive channel